jgi:hypothetical protein
VAPATSATCSVNGFLDIRFFVTPPPSYTRGVQSRPIVSQEPHRNRTMLVLLSLAALDVVYIVLRLLLANTLPFAGLIAGVALVIAIVRARSSRRRSSEGDRSG